MLLQYPLRPRYRQYGDQGDLVKAELAVHSKNVETKGTKRIEEEPANLKLHYQLNSGVNYNHNADGHRIKMQTLLSTPVDTCGQAVDSTFATVDLKVQANYAIGVFKDNKFVLTPLQKFHQVRPSFEHVDKEREARQIKSDGQQKSEREAAERLTRIGAAKTGTGDAILDTKWVPIQLFQSTSEESGDKFEEMLEFTSEDQRMDATCKLQNKKEYGDQVAPVYLVEDFSTAQLQKDRGDSLSGDKLSVLTPQKMIETILKKAGVIHYSRLYNILVDACAISKLQIPTVQEVVDYMQRWAYVLAEEKLFIARGELLDDQSPR